MQEILKYNIWILLSNALFVSKIKNKNGVWKKLYVIT